MEDRGMKDFVESFKNSLQKQNQHKSISLYHDDKKSNSNITNFNAKDVFFNISQQVKAMHSADTTIKVKNKMKLKEFKRKDFIPVSMISNDQPPKATQANKFDTQCVSDTELIDIIEKAEALINKENDISQKLDNNFHYTNISFEANNKEKIPKIHKIDTTNLKAINKILNSNIFEPFSENKTYNDMIKEKSDTVNILSVEQNTHAQMDNIIKTQNNSLDNIFNNNEEISNSPIINKSNSYIMKSKTPSPLIFGLDSFEKFEAIAMPVIENNLETSVAKQIIHSQVISNELYIKRHTEPVLIDRDKSLSPILTIRKKSTDSTIIKIKNGRFTIEDSILFSSDEENEIKNEELPLTCALKTSFYNEHDLNETMYVGFQTASDKSIQICSDSYNKAKSLLCVKSIDIPLTKLVEVMDSSNNIINKNTQKEIKENKISVFNHNLSDSATKQSQQNEDESKSVLRKSNNICDKNNIWDESTTVIASNNNEIKLFPVSPSCEEKIEVRNNNLCNNISQDILLSTGAVSNIPVSEKEQVNIDDNIIKEFETNFLVENDDITNPFENKKNNLALKAPESNINDKIFPSETEQALIQTKGFKTANKNKINTHKLDEIKDIFKDIDLTDIGIGLDDYKENCVNNIDTPATASKNFIGFQTASHKSIKISEQALANTKKIFQDIKNDDTIHAFGSNIINKKNRNYEINTLNTEETSSKPLYPINESKTVLCSYLNMINNNNSYLNEELKQKNDKVKETPKFVGFQTANNKPVTISKEAFAKSKKIFQDIEKEIPANSENNIKNFSDKFQRFQTDNKAIAISKDAIQKSKKMYDVKECDVDIQCLIKENDSIEKFEGFKTASNKPVQISEESLAKSKNIFQGIDCSDDNLKEENQKNKMDPNRHPKINVGFHTASDKPIVISNEALAKTKNIFDNIDIINNNSNKNDNCDIQNKFQGFRTLSKSKHIFQDVEMDEKLVHNFDKNKANTNFGGFKTASSKQVHISETALIKSKELKNINESNTKKDTVSEYSAFGGFQTASNKKINVSEKALYKSRKLFEGINITEEKETIKVSSNDDLFKKPCLDNVNDESLDKATKTNDNNVMNIDDLMNTEVIKDLEETMCTEDFIKENTPSNKRSSSPILSCPRAKKRKKFEMPIIIKPVKTVGSENNENRNIIHTFDSNYKTHKKLNLQNIIEIEKQNYSNTEIDSNISKFRFDTLLQFEFGEKRNDIDSDVWNTDKIQQLFTDSVNKRMIPKGWIENHLKLIIWKLLSYEIVFPKTMNNVCTIKNVLNQLKYRYDRELYNVERPALRKILEKDEISSKRIVLCVVGVYVDGSYVNSIAHPTQNLELLLTDGWYTIMSSTDAMINKLIFDGKITVGTKLVIHGAELLNCEQGVAPWENTSPIRLKIFGNSTRRAKWNARLGFHGNGAMLSHLSSVKMEGGKVSRVKVFITRVYPMLYVERFDDGSTVTRSERLENLYQIKYENEKQNQLEKLYEEVEKYSDKESQDSESLDTERDLDSGTQLCKLMKMSKDPIEFRAGLTHSQIKLLQEHSSKERDKLIEKLQQKVQELVKKRGLDVNRIVVPLLKMRVADLNNKSNHITKAMITIWRPNESLLDLIKEGTWIEIFNIVPTSIRYSEMQLSAGRQSIFKKAMLKENDSLKSITQTLKRTPFTLKDLQKPITIDYNEIDTFGFIFLIEPSTKEYEGSKQLFQNVYISDEYKNVIAINFWGGIKKFGFENILETGQIVSCVNLQRRHGSNKKCSQQFRATEFTYFTKTCKIDMLRIMTDKFSRKLSSLDKTLFIEECVVVKNNFANTKHSNTHFSPYRLNNSEYNITKNKIFIDSPANKCVDANLTGLDFESSFKETDTKELSPKTVRRKRKVDEKIAKLEMYGEPPPLQPIHIINKSNIINNSYKSPLLIKNNDNIQNASIMNMSKNLSSPVCLNRAYVKNINPVKLNFSSNNMSEDPFADEFEGSPPLSLE